MKHKRIGTIIHGAIGDCYEQLCAIKIIKKESPLDKWIGFFAVNKRLIALKHFNLDMLDEIYLADEIPNVDVEHFYQFQINDSELREEIIDKLPEKIKLKFDFTHNIKPWHVIRRHDFRRSGLELGLSDVGKKYLLVCMENNGIDQAIFNKRTTIGYLWRYRSPGGPIKNYLQRSKDWIIKSKSELFHKLIAKYNAHIVVAGMKKIKTNIPSASQGVLDRAGFRDGEYRTKYTDATLDVPAKRCTYLKGIGYAAEMEIMSKCDLLLTMPSGFSEPLWMKRRSPVVLVDPPPDYVLKVWWNRMPFFYNYNPIYAYHNIFVKHSAKNMLRFLEKRRLITKKSGK